MSKFLFSTFDVTKQVFYRSRLCTGIVNLQPILPGHVLVIPNRIVSRLSDLNNEEVADVFQTVRTIGRVIEKEFDGESLTVAIQDGPAAGQSVPHLHVHVIPRRFTDFDGKNDDIYPALEASEELLGETNRKKKPALMSPDAARAGPRTSEEMEKEATWLQTLFKQEDAASISPNQILE